MSIAEFSAIAYALFACIPVVFQIALAFGAPWGEYALAGRWHGALPGYLRPFAVLQAGILILMAMAVLTRADVMPLNWPDWSFWMALFATASTCLANTITPSLAERKLWSPITAAMLVLGILVGLA